MAKIKILKPKSEFYEVFSKFQIYDIIRSIELHKEIPRQYNYIAEGARNWDKYTKKLIDENVTNTLSGTIGVLESNWPIISQLLDDYKKVNLIDIGVGNAMPVKGVLGHLLEDKKLGRYIGLDISSEMLDIAQNNINKWFEKSVKFEGRELDVSFNRFSEVVVDDYLAADFDCTTNLVVMLGGTASNFREPWAILRNIRETLGPNDFFVYTTKLDNEATRNYFDFYYKPQDGGLAPNHRYILDLLTVTPDLYEVESGYDEELHQRFVRIRMLEPIVLEFDFEAGKRKVVLEAGERVLQWRARQEVFMGIIKMLESNGLRLVHANKSKDGQFALIISQVRTV